MSGTKTCKEDLLEELQREKYEPLPVIDRIPEPWKEPALSFQRSKFDVFGADLLFHLLDQKHTNLKEANYQNDPESIVKVEIFEALPDFGRIQFLFSLDSGAVYNRGIVLYPSCPNVALSSSWKEGKAGRGFQTMIIGNDTLVGFELMGDGSGEFVYQLGEINTLLDSPFDFTDSQRRWLLRRI